MIDRSITVRPNNKGNITIPIEWIQLTPAEPDQDEPMPLIPIFRTGGDAVIINGRIVTVPKTIPKLTMHVHSPGRLDTYRYEQHDGLGPSYTDGVGLDSYTPGFRAETV
jgi:hypothetical protein